jgi:hypothetical protein
MDFIESHLQHSSFFQTIPSYDAIVVRSATQVDEEVFKVRCDHSFWEERGWYLMVA